MKDIFGNSKPVQIEVDEYWYNGRIIQKQSHPLVSKWVSFEDNDTSNINTHTTKKEAIQYCLENPCKTPEYFPEDYIGGIKMINCGCKLFDLEKKIEQLYDKMFEKRIGPNDLIDWYEISFFGGKNENKYKEKIKELLLDGKKVKTGYRCCDIRGVHEYKIFWK
jgi:hypothetical protein